MGPDAAAPLRQEANRSNWRWLGCGGAEAGEGGEAEVFSQDSSTALRGAELRGAPRLSDVGLVGRAFLTWKPGHYFYELVAQTLVAPRVLASGLRMLLEEFLVVFFVKVYSDPEVYSLKEGSGRWRSTTLNLIASEYDVTHAVCPEPCTWLVLHAVCQLCHACAKYVPSGTRLLASCLGT